MVTIPSGLEIFLSQNPKNTKKWFEILYISESYMI